MTLAQPLAFWIAEKGIPIEQGYALLDLVSEGERLPETLRTEIEQTYYEPKGETEEAFRNSMRSMASILKELGEYAASLMEQDNPEEGVDCCTQYYFIYPDPLEKTVQIKKEELP